MLLKELDHHGIRGTPLKLFENYLTNRKQCVNINGVLWELINIDLGVPQGSTLGPILFLIFINDLPGASKLITKLFADDTCLVFSANSVAELQHIANIEISQTENWMTSNKLTLNYSKTKFRVIHKNCSFGFCQHIHKWTYHRASGQNSIFRDFTWCKTRRDGAPERTWIQIITAIRFNFKITTFCWFRLFKKFLLCTGVLSSPICHIGLGWEQSQ